MFLVEDKRHGVTHLVFTYEDPRKSGFRGNVIEDVELIYDMQAVHLWADGEQRPEARVGRSPKNPKHYKVFKYAHDLQEAGFHPVNGDAVVFGSWDEYVRVQLIPPDPDQTPDEPWYAYLDRLDEDSRRRRLRAQEPAPSKGASRDEVAAWVARNHLLADSSLREVWYLPKGAPGDEIRLLDLSDRNASNGHVAPLDFGLDIEGAQFRLLVADVTTEQIERMKKEAALLPKGWTFEDSRMWRRGQ